MLSNKLLLLIVLILMFQMISEAFGQEYTPGQILFKTSRSLEIQRGRTGLTMFDEFLNDVQAVNVVPIKGMKNNQWFSANISNLADWEAIREHSLRFDGIDIVQPNYLNNFHIVPNDPWYSLQQLNLVSLPDAWNYTTGSSMIVVGIVDSGILKDHPDLLGNIYYNPHEISDNSIDDDNNGYIDDYCGWDFSDAPEMADVALGDFMDQDNDVTDENFHGTHVSGILGAATNNSIGIAGVCWNVKILPLRAGFRTTTGTGFLQDDDAAAAIIYATDMGVSVMNLSWGDPNYSPIIADACNYAYQRGVVIVASAGNDPGPFLSYPAKLSSVISVGAVDPYKNLAGFSSYGPELDLVAPGQQIYSTYKTTEPDVYKEMSGTSMSSPFVAGAAALIKSIQPNLSPDEVKARILTSTDDLGTQGYDTFFGHGLLNVKKALENISSPIINISYPPDHIGVSEDFPIIGTVNCPDFFRYSVMCAIDLNSESLNWKDVFTNQTSPSFYNQPVLSDTIAFFRIHDLMAEGQYVIRIQYETYYGVVFNHYMTVLLDRTPPFIKQNTFTVLKRYDGQNVRYYAGALFNEPVRAELLVFGPNMSQFSVFPEKMDSIQVWLLPNTIPQGSVDLKIKAINRSNLTYESGLMVNAANIQYEIVPNHGFEPREIGNPLVPLNRTFDFDQNGIPEIPAMELPISGYGNISYYEPTDSVFTKNYSYNTKFWPMDLGNTNASGMELLGLNLDTASLYETTSPNTYPTSNIWSETGISGGLIADYNGDNIKDILLVKNLPAERVVQLYKRMGLIAPVVSPKITLRNTSPTNLRNMFVPTVICKDFDNDGTPDVLTADTDGDLMIYEVTGETTASLSWTHRLPVTNTYYLTSGDYNGDGVPDFFVGGSNTDVLDVNQTYWFFEGFTSIGNNQYSSMGYIQFIQVMSQNAIQSFDIDNDSRDELILSISPNLYVLKYMNGYFQPIYHGLSSRTYQIATWKHQNQPYFLTNRLNAADSVKAFVWSKQAAFTGPATPANLIVRPLNASQVSLNWQSNNADFYRIYRKTDSTTPLLLAEAIYPTYRDTTVIVDNIYYYSVTAVKNSMSPPESIPSQWMRAIPKSPPLVSEIVMIGSNELRITFDQPLMTSSLNPGCYYVDHNIGIPLSVNSVLSGYGVQLKFRNVFLDIGSFYLLKLQNIYGITGVAPIQTLYSFSFNPDYIPPAIVSVDVMSDNRSVRITMSETIYPETAQQISNYTLYTPSNDSYNSLRSIDADDNIITVTLNSKMKFSNQPYYLILNNITDLAGNPITPNLNSCRFTRNDVTNLENVIVYPNPVKVVENDFLNFMNFPEGKKGKLHIYNTTGDLVFSSGIGPFNRNNNNIIFRWDMRNNNGKKISSGLYYYLIHMDNHAKRGKIAILN